MAEYIEREALIAEYDRVHKGPAGGARKLMVDAPACDVVEVVRCQDCVHAVPLDRNCELSTSLYMHCCLWRGDETKNVWHKYKKYYKDYSLVYRDDYCSAGVREDGADNEMD